MSGYTLGGAASSLLIGALLASLGKVMFLSSDKSLLWCVVAASLVAAAREAGVVSFPLPQWRRQTNGLWAKIFVLPVAATLWGLDLGLLFTSWFTFSGTWALVALAVLAPSARVAAALIGAYWLGRALPVWVSPALLPNAASTADLLGVLARQYRQLQKVHVASLCVLATVLALWLVGPVF